MVLIAASVLFQITSALFANKIRCAISSYAALQIANCTYINKNVGTAVLKKSYIWIINCVISNWIFKVFIELRAVP